MQKSLDISKSAIIEDAIRIYGLSDGSAESLPRMRYILEDGRILGDKHHFKITHDDIVGSKALANRIGPAFHLYESDVCPLFCKLTGAHRFLVDVNDNVICFLDKPLTEAQTKAFHNLTTQHGLGIEFYGFTADCPHSFLSSGKITYDGLVQSQNEALETIEERKRSGCYGYDGF